MTLCAGVLRVLRQVVANGSDAPNNDDNNKEEDPGQTGNRISHLAVGPSGNNNLKVAELTVKKGLVLGSRANGEL